MVTDFVEQIGLVDHHVHSPPAGEPGHGDFGPSGNEGCTGEPWMTQLGFGIRRWCAPLLDLPPHASADDYWRRRCELGAEVVTARFLRGAGVSDWLVAPGTAADGVLDLAAMAAMSGARSHRIVLLESVAERLLMDGFSARDYADRFRARLAEETVNVVAVQTILAYRYGFDLDLTRPDPTSVRIAASRWRDTGLPRIEDPVLLRFGLHAAVELGLPLQIHTGFGGRDPDLFRCNPLLLRDFLRLPQVTSVPVLLLRCYPYHREAGYLAQAFPNVYFDIGLAVSHLGVRAVELIAESFELAPFAKQLYSSGARGLPELHYLGAALWRQALDRLLTRWVSDDDWSTVDARRVAEMVGRRNALGVYGLE